MLRAGIGALLDQYYAKPMPTLAFFLARCIQLIKAAYCACDEKVDTNRARPK
jgi:hypothetical protein